MSIEVLSSGLQVDSLVWRMSYCCMADPPLIDDKYDGDHSKQLVGNCRALVHHLLDVIKGIELPPGMLSQEMWLDDERSLFVLQEALLTNELSTKIAHLHLQVGDVLFFSTITSMSEPKHYHVAIVVGFESGEPLIAHAFSAKNRPNHLGGNVLIWPVSRFAEVTMMVSSKVPYQPYQYCIGIKRFFEHQ